MLVKRSNPQGLVVELDVLKAALRVSGDADDARLTHLVRAETARYEDFTGRVMQPTDFSIALDGWLFPARLPVLPLREVAAITYLDAEHVEQTLDVASWYVSESAPFWSVGLDRDAGLPALSDRPSPVRVDFSAGYDLPLAEGDEVTLLAPRADDQNAIIHMIGVAYDQGAPMAVGEMRKVFGNRRVAGW